MDRNDRCVLFGLHAGLTLAIVALVSSVVVTEPPRRTSARGFDSPGEAMAFRLLQQQDENGVVPPNALEQARAHVDQMREAVAPYDAGISRNAWTWLGPGNIGGRVRAIAIDPATPATWFAGSVSGGIWKTTNSGASWTVVDDFMANLAVSSIVINPVTPQTMYAGTGEGFYNFDGIRGAGIFKSTDGGTTWNQLPSTANSDFYYVNRLAISPNGSTLLAAARAGIFRSVDGGATFASVLATSNIMDVKFHPTNSSLAIAGGRLGNAWYTTNGGTTWTAATGLTAAASSSRVELAYAPGLANVVYASVDENDGTVYKSADGGVTYTFASRPVVSGYTLLGGQGWYDNAIWVDPLNDNNVVIAGVWLWKSTDGGLSFTHIPAIIHTDFHAFVTVPGTNHSVVIGNDGGVHYAANMLTAGQTTSFETKNNNLGVTQYYGAAGNATTGTVVGGTQDNGTLRYRTASGPQAHDETYSADGGFAAADPTDSNYFYGETQWLGLHRSSDGGATAVYLGTKIPDSATQTTNFISPFILHPNDPNVLLAGGRDLWRSTNIKASSASVSFTSIKAGVAISATSYSNISAIAAVPSSSSQTCYVGHNNGNIYRSDNCLATTPSWTQIDTSALPNRMVLRLTVDPSNTSRVYATFSGFFSDNVWRSDDAGTTWSSASGSGATALPPAPARDLDVHPTNSNWLYAATEVGIFTSTDMGATWHLPHDGPANVSVDETFFLGTRLYAATHGRGIYSVATTNAPTISTIANQTTTLGTSVTAAFTISDADTATAALSVSGVSSNTSLLPNSGITFGGSDANRTVTLTPAAGVFGTTTVTITVSDGTSTATSSFTFTVTAPPAIAAIADQSTTTGVAITAGITVSDPDTAAGSLSLSGSSSNTTLLPNANITFGGSGGSRTVTLAPAAGQTGTATVTIAVSDGSATATRSFALTVSAGPGNLAAVVRGNLVTFTWTAATMAGVQGYVLEAGTSPGTTSQVVPVGNVTTYPTSAPSGVFYVRVRVVVNGAQTLASNEITVAIGDAAIPGAPTNLLATVNGATIYLAWQNTDIGGTRSSIVLDASTASGASLGSFDLGPSAESFAGLAPSNNYVLRVRATGPAGASAPSNTVTPSVPGTCSAPATPLGLTATAVGSAVTISWSLGAIGTPAPASFVLEAGSAPGTANAAVVPIGGRVLRASAPPGTYYLRVRAVNPCGASANTADVTLVVS